MPSKSRSMVPAAAFIALAITAACPAWAKDRSSAAVPQTPASWIMANDYPPTALRDGKEGVSTIRWDVSTEGRAGNCTVVATSGSTDLDQAACTLIVERARYTPALDRKGKPVRSTVTQRIRWQIPVGQPNTTVPYVLRPF